MISIKGVSKAKVLAALYNRATCQGMGVFHFEPQDMTEDEAQSLLDEGITYFDYLKGRVMKVSLKGDEFSEALYDRDNGEGAAYEAIRHLL